MTEAAFCTILARNYLPKALALADSLRRHGYRVPLTVVLTDATEATLPPPLESIRWMTPSQLDLPSRDLLDLAMSYDLVEFATAIKPLVLLKLLRDHEQVGYLDPDTYVTSPMVELTAALAGGPTGIVLTPHYLQPVPSGQHFSEGHLLAVGVYNLGFCLVDRRSQPFLQWWWGHLRTECLHDYIAGLFVDQKWVDVGAVLFDATPLRHRGYNVSVANLHERPIGRDASGYHILDTKDRLRLFHFHAFDTAKPQELSTRRGESTAHLRMDSAALDALCKEYAAALIEKEQSVGPTPAYGYGADTTGRPITRRLRHAYRVAVQAAPGAIPSPFLAGEAADYERWRRRSWNLVSRLMLSDVAKGVRCALPDEYATFKNKVPGLTARLRGRLSHDTGMWA